MKILKNIAIEKLDRDTKHIFDFIDGLPNDSIKNHFEIECALGQLNNLRNLLGLPKLFVSFRPIPMPKVKPAKEERHEHDYFILHTSPTNATICCRSCGEVKHIETNVPMKKATPKQYINISIDEFCDYCDAAASFKELKELLFERPAMQEGESW